jgi:radical SAM protein with 4Fe4S-binding SPASM domain
MKEIGEYGVKAIVLAGCGEPMLHSKTPEAIKIAVANGIDVGMFTNGVFLPDDAVPTLMDNLTYIRFTINGGSEKSHHEIHRSKEGDFEKIKQNLRKLVSYKKEHGSKTTIGVYTLMFKPNLHELEDWVKEVRDIGADYIMIKPPGLGVGNVKYVEPPDIEECKPIFERIAKMGNENFKVQIRYDLFEDSTGCRRKGGKEYGKCLGLPFMCAVDADGSVYACNWFWGNEDFKYGDLNKNTFAEIWESKRKSEILKKVSSDSFDMTKCGACRQDSINNYLWELNNPPDHVNFI